MPMVSSWDSTSQAVILPSKKVVATWTQLSWPIALVTYLPSTGLEGLVTAEAASEDAASEDAALEAGALVVLEAVLPQAVSRPAAAAPMVPIAAPRIKLRREILAIAVCLSFFLFF